jgi:hypothetical protein
MRGVGKKVKDRSCRLVQVVEITRCCVDILVDAQRSNLEHIAGLVQQFEASSYFRNTPIAVIGLLVCLGSIGVGPSVASSRCQSA